MSRRTRNPDGSGAVKSAGSCIRRAAAGGPLAKVVTGRLGTGSAAAGPTRRARLDTMPGTTPRSGPGGSDFAYIEVYETISSTKKVALIGGYVSRHCHTKFPIWLAHTVAIVSVPP